MRKRRPVLILVATVVAGLSLVAFCFAAFTGPRSALVRIVAQIALYQRGMFYLSGGTLRVESNELWARDVTISDRNGQAVFSARSVVVDFDPRFLIGRSDRALGLESVALDGAHLRIVRLEDGTFNVQPLIRSAPRPPPPGAKPAPIGPPYRVTVNLTGGVVDVIDPLAPAAPGHLFSFKHLAGFASYNQGGLSTGKITGVMVERSHTAPMIATLFENDPAGFADARVSITRAPLAPVIDGLIPSRLFAVDSGYGTTVLRAYAFGYAGEPQWHYSGSVAVHDGKLRVVPLIVPIGDISGSVRFNGAMFTSTGLRGWANGIPIFARGGIQAIPSVSFAIQVSGGGPLRNARTLFAFSKQMPVHGSMQARLRISGPLDGINVSGPVVFPGTSAYENVVMTRLAGQMFYHAGHLTLSDLAASYDGGSIVGGGDFDLSGAVPAGQFIIAGRIPASRIPIAANLNPTGTAQALVTMEGPLPTISGEGFAEITGGAGGRVRTAFVGGPQRFGIGPMLVQSAGGELLMEGALDRTAPRAISGVAIATRTPLHLIAKTVALPGIGAPVWVPATSGVLDGVLLIAGPPGGPQVVVAANIGALDIGAAQLGDVRVIAGGAGNDVRIARVSFSGRDVSANASGYAALSPASGTYAAALQGAGAVNLSAIGGSLPVSGRANGNFKAVFSRGRWLVSAAANSSDAVVSGIPVRVASGVVGGGRLGPDLFGGIAQAGGGDVGAVGRLNAPGNSVAIWADNVDARQLGAMSPPIDSGTGFAIGSLTRGTSGMNFSGSVAITDAAYRGIPVGGDADVTYAGGKIIGSGRADIAGNLTDVSGAIADIGAGAPQLDLNAGLREGSAALLNRWLPHAAPVTGSVSARLHITGTPSDPRAGGYVASDNGTIRGVAYENLRGFIRATRNSFGVDAARVTFGSSTLAFSGVLSPSQVSVDASSPALTLSDFNDFFDGWDTLEGLAHGRASVRITPSSIGAGGSVALRRATIVGVPLGSVDADFSTFRSALVAQVRQRGPIGAAEVEGAVTLPARRSTALDLRHAFYDVTGVVHGLDMSIAAPLLGGGRYNVSGLLDAHGTVHGQLAHPAAYAAFNLRDGRIGSTPIERFDGLLTSDGTSVSLSSANIALPFATATGSGRWFFDGHITGDVRAQADDLGKVAARFGDPQALSGSGTAAATLSGTIKRPVAIANIESVGTLYGVKYDRFAGRLAYAPGQLEIADTRLDFGPARGVLTLSGALPLELAPVGLGPPDKRLDMRLDLASIDLADLNPLTHGRATLAGSLNAKASVTGTAGRPVLAGSARITGASVASTYETVPATNVAAALTFHNDSLDISQLSGTLGGGSFSVRGAGHVVPAVGLRRQAGLEYWTHATLRGAQVNVPNWISGTFDGDLTLTKIGVTPYLAGDVSLRDGVVPLSAVYALATKFSGAQPASPSRAPGVPPLRPGHTIVYGGTIYGDAVHVLTSSPNAQATTAPRALPLFNLNVALNAGKNVAVKGGGMDITAAGGVLLGGSTRGPTLAGRFRSTRGQLTYFDRNFRIDNGIVSFDPEQGLLPTLYVKALTSTEDADVTVEVSGRIDHLTTTLTALPPMSQDQIIALLLHEPQLRSVVEGNTPDAAQSAVISAAQSYFNAQLTRSILFPFETALSQTLDIEQISLTFDPLGNVNLEVRKRISPSAYGIYRTTLTAPTRQSYGFAYALRERAAIEFLQTQSPSGLQSVVLDIRFQFH